MQNEQIQILTLATDDVTTLIFPQVTKEHTSLKTFFDCASEKELQRISLVLKGNVFKCSVLKCGVIRYNRLFKFTKHQCG